MDRIDLDLTVCCVVGILPRERLEPQRLRIEIGMELDLEAVARTGDLSKSVDYGAVDAMARFLAVEGQFLLIESLGLCLLQLLLLPPGPGEARAQVERASVRLEKPDVLLSASPAIAMSRDRQWAAQRAPTTVEFGVQVDEILSLPDVSIARIAMPSRGRAEGGALLELSGAGGRLASPFDARSPCTVLQVVRR